MVQATQQKKKLSSESLDGEVAFVSKWIQWVKVEEQ